ncbi:MAG: class I SAM-dependent methyltransferase, partial [Daejeonella sp.]|uniref:class I SAM-dependent methyltransferase n=1 Tax=Daejeonella sp. TaxID=2805397 RepID=UPI003C747F95
DIDVNEFYDGKDYTVKDTRDSIFFKIQKAEYGSVINTIQNTTRNQTPFILDFGSGKGLFLHFAALKGCQVKGIESSKPRAEYARKYFGLTVNTDYYTSGSVLNSRFDVITMFHVLEHLQNPSELMSNLVKSNLKPGGLLIAEVPNFGSWQSRWAGNRWLHLDVPRHLTHFTDSSLEKIIDNADCRVIRKEYYSLHLGIVGMVQSIFAWFGYKGFLIADLKENKSRVLLAMVLLVLPFAVLLEGLAVLFKKGGIIRCYAVYEPKDEDTAVANKNALPE